jgi:uncharacterized membrane protein
MTLSRVARHLLCADWLVHRAFPPACRRAIAQAIRTSEQTHAGEIRFAIEGGLDAWPLLRRQTARQRAIEVFSQLRVWDTEHNNGVLIYVLLADQAVEIVADRGIHAKVGNHTWNAICQQMQCAFSKSEFRTGAIQGVEALSDTLRKHCAQNTVARNELPDAPVLVR